MTVVGNVSQKNDIKKGSPKRHLGILLFPRNQIIINEDDSLECQWP